MPSLARRVAAESLGTAFLLAAVVGSGIMAQRLAGGNGAIALLCNTLPTGAILVVLILVFGPLSGAHFNPAVSIAFVLRRELPWPTAATYVAAQIGGGILGVAAAHLMFELPLWQLSTTARTGAGQWFAEAIARGVARWRHDVVLIGLAGSQMLEVFREAGFAVAAEAFADRRYEPDGTLRSRKFDDALIRDPAEAGRQALNIVRRGTVIACDGSEVSISAQTICMTIWNKQSRCCTWISS